MSEQIQIENKTKEKRSFKQVVKDINFKVKLQKSGSFMAGMIMPSIGVLLAWGLWTAMFLYDFDNNKALGWFDVPMLGRLVEPGIKWLLPILIAFNGGRLIYGLRGGMFATFVILGAIIGTEWIYGEFIWIVNKDGLSVHPGSPNQFIGAMVLGPLSALVLKNVEKLYLTRINKSYDMLVKNFGMGIYGIILALAAFFGWGWIMWGITYCMMELIGLFGNNKWVAPLIGIFTEPVKVSFLNNALNHGVLGPIGYNQMNLSGANRSIFFLYDPNPGPGLGLLLAYIIFTKGESRYNAAGSSLIHTVGGIHEVYFVFILSKPKMILATIAGVVSAQFVASYLDGGTVATPSPGSIISLIALSPGAYAIGINVLAFIVGVGTSFGIASLILILDKKKNVNTDLNFKITDEGISFGNNLDSSLDPKVATGFSWNNVKRIVVACEAGMGSSAMAAGIINKWVKQNNLEIEVSNIAVKDLTNDYDIIVTMKNFKDFAQKKSPEALIYPVDKFIGSGVYDELYNNLTKNLIEEKKEK